MYPLFPTRAITPSGATWLLLLAALLLALATRPVAAQVVPVDTTHLHYGEETSPTPPVPPATTFGRSYRQLVRLQIEEQVLWKLGLNNLDFRYFDDKRSREVYGLHLIYEGKLRRHPDFSILGEVSPALLRYRGAASNDSWQSGLVVNAQVAGRYYYNLAHRIRKGKSANNFSANYLSLALGSSFGRHSTDTPFHHYDAEGAPVRLDGALLYGLQRRLGRYGFVDFNFGIPFRLLSGQHTPLSSKGIEPELTLRIGLALGR